jgi:FkbM family methyltransferase
MRSLILNNNLMLVAGRHGYFLINLNDVYVGQALALYGEYCADEAAFLGRIIKPGNHVVEVGANIGSHTIGLAKAVGPHGKVYAFEPQPACYSLLQAQIALNQTHQVRAYNEGLGQSLERLWLPFIDYSKPNNFGGASLSRDQSPQGELIDVTTLDSRLPDVPVSLIKIDVEGMEEDVIRGGSNLIRKHRPLLYVENDRIEKSRSLVALIMELGYRLWWHIPDLYCKNNFFQVGENIFGKAASFNMFCACHDHEAAAGLLEIKSPDDPHPLAPKPLAPKPRPGSVQYRFS